MASLKEIADQAGVDLKIVRNILNETPGMRVPKDIADKVFKTARSLGYDLKKLKLGKRMHLRKETLEEIVSAIEGHPTWDRRAILDHLKKSCQLIERTHKRAFAEEFGEEDE